ncbi:hypothetical protein TELCIR_17669 [Teladorsagia circumcincta]|uniref:Uncharacterized protein n=1 Tax=Teladorsagia circumcincta TaxID=45464 RepID=A0A2G9TS44_TELCI|nr:hypothetical protein TELCIR_17669 [Teladorsagia circumcincta]
MGRFALVNKLRDCELEFHDTPECLDPPQRIGVKAIARACLCWQLYKRGAMKVSMRTRAVFLIAVSWIAGTAVATLPLFNAFGFAE